MGDKRVTKITLQFRAHSVGYEKRIQRCSFLLFTVTEPFNSGKELVKFQLVPFTVSERSCTTCKTFPITGTKFSVTLIRFGRKAWLNWLPYTKKRLKGVCMQDRLKWLMISIWELVAGFHSFVKLSRELRKKNLGWSGCTNFIACWHFYPRKCVF